MHSLVALLSAPALAFVQVLSDGRVFADLCQLPEVQQHVLAKQVASFNKALSLLHSHQ
jgi:hypothetical protein